MQPQMVNFQTHDVWMIHLILYLQTMNYVLNNFFVIKHFKTLYGDTTVVFHLILISIRSRRTPSSETVNYASDITRLIVFCRPLAVVSFCLSLRPFYNDARSYRERQTTEVSTKRERPLTNGFNAFLPHRRILYEIVSGRAPTGYVAPSIWHALFARTIHIIRLLRYRDVDYYEIYWVCVFKL